MAGGIMGKLTHLQAFCSPDAKRGRVWKDSDGSMYRRDGVFLEVYNTIKGRWETYARQAAATDWQVTWADEPKTLTQVEYPLNYDEAIAAAVGGAVVSAMARPECRYWYSRGFRYMSPSTKTVAVYDGWDADDEEMCCGKWRIVKEGK